jgi:hypothetical protein
MSGATPYHSIGWHVKKLELVFPLKIMPLSSPTLRLVFRPIIPHTQHQEARPRVRGEAALHKKLGHKSNSTVNRTY